MIWHAREAMSRRGISSILIKMRERILFIVVLFLAVSYHAYFRNFLFTFLGLGRSLQQIKEFAYACHRLEHPSLSSCEDIWLDEESRTLYAACGDMPSRTHWLPGYIPFEPCPDTTPP
jgi:hypothetical protein